MKYIYIPKNEEKEQEITREEAIRMMSGNYRDPEYVLDNAIRLFTNEGGLTRIGLQFGYIQLIKY